MDVRLTLSSLASSNALLLSGEDPGVGDGTLLAWHVGCGEVTEGGVLRSGKQLVVAALHRDGARPLQQLAEMVLDAHRASDGCVLLTGVHFTSAFENKL